MVLSWSGSGLGLGLGLGLARACAQSQGVQPTGRACGPHQAGLGGRVGSRGSDGGRDGSGRVDGPGGAAPSRHSALGPTVPPPSREPGRLRRAG
eukprot:scaffold10977_cov75-Phaeocystis_antarctica.AAC.1